MTQVSYVTAVPGDCPTADAFNLVLAGFRGDQCMAEAIVKHQVEGLEPLLGNLTAFVMRLIAAQGDGDPGPVLAMWREIASALTESGRPGIATPRERIPA